MDLSEATFLQLAIQLNVSVTVDKAVYIEYSISGGVTWTTLTRIYYNRAKRNINTQATQSIFDLPTDAQTESTRIRLWQPGSLEENDAVWRLDDFYIGGAKVSPPMNVESDFATSLPPEMWPSYAGGLTGASYCGRDGVLLFNSSSSGLHHLTSTFLDLSAGLNLIQFEVTMQATILVQLKYIMYKYVCTLSSIYILLYVFYYRHKCCTLASTLVNTMFIGPCTYKN